MTIKNTIVCLFVFGFACQSSIEKSKEEQATKQVVFDIISADNRSDIEVVLSLYDSSAILMPPGKPTISGITAIRKNYIQIFANSKMALKTDVESVKIADDWANLTGRNTGSVMSLHDSSLKTIDSKYMMLLQKAVDKKWKIKMLIWNDN